MGRGGDVTSPYFCQCCGCVSGDVLPGEYAYGSLFNIGGRIIDNPQSFGASTVTADVKWTRTGVGNSTTICGGSSTVDARANSLRMDLTWSPFVLRLPSAGNAQLTYAPGQPATDAEKVAEARLSVYDAEAIFRTELVQRDLPDNFFQIWAIGYVEVPNQQPPQFGVGRPLPYGEPLHGIPAQISARQSVNPFNDPQVNASRAFLDLPEVAATNTPAHSGTPLAGFKSRTMPEIASYVTYSELCSIRYVNWSASATDGTSGFDQKTTIEFSGKSRLVTFRSTTTGQPVAVTTYVTPGGDDDTEVDAVVTAYAGRALVPGYPYDDTTFTQSARRTQIFRDGVQVLDMVGPTQQQIDDAMLEEGSYLFVYTTTGTLQHGPPNGVRIPPLMLKEFDSAVVDTTPPALGFTVPPDGYEVTLEEPYYAPANKPVILFSTEPLITNGQFFDGSRPFVCFPDEQADSVTARPSLRNNVDAGLLAPITLRGITSTPTAGTYTITPIEDNAVRDLAGNFPAVIPSVQVTIHERPEDNHLGATPTIQDPGLLTREYYRTRLQNQKVTSLRLTFDRKVVASEVDSSQLRLLKDGVEVGGCTLEQVGDSGTEWEITIPEEPQAERAFMVLEYDPAGDVHTDDIVTITYASQDRFPQTGKPRVVYQFEDGQAMRRFSWGRRQQGDTLGYVELSEGEPPIDEAGYPYEPEPCVLASRVSWLMADSRGWPRKIDVSSVTGQIGRVASVTDEREISKEAITSTVSGNGGMLIPQSLGTFSPLLNYRGYVPCVPPPTDPPADCSYFGLTTTIDPCPPAEVSPCAAPRVAQRHASAIISDEDIETIELELVAFQGATPKDWSSYQFPSDAQTDLFYPAFADVDVAIIPSSFINVVPNLAAVLLSKIGSPFTMANTLQGVPTSQNVWFAIGQPGSSQVPIQQKYSRRADYIVTQGPDAGSYHTLAYRITPGSTSVPPGFPAGWEVSYGGRTGLVRVIAPDSSIQLTGAQACLSAFRECRTYPALKTTTLAELQFRVSVRLAARATVVYQDKRLNPTKFIHPNPALRTQLYSYSPSLMDAYGAPPVFPQELIGVQELGNAATEDTKTVAHDFLMDIYEDRIVLSREQEQRFANGEEVFFPVSRVFQEVGALNATFYWKLKKG